MDGKNTFVRAASGFHFATARVFEFRQRHGLASGVVAIRSVLKIWPYGLVRLGSVTHEHTCRAMEVICGVDMLLLGYIKPHSCDRDLFVFVLG